MNCDLLCFECVVCYFLLFCVLWFCMGCFDVLLCVIVVDFCFVWCLFVWCVCVVDVVCDGGM